VNFTFSEEQLMAVETARQILTDTCSPALLRAQLVEGAARDTARWQALTDSGLAAILVPEAAGGMGLGVLDFVQIAEACGYAALPEPLVEHAGVAAPLLAATGHQTPLLAHAATGAATIAVGHPINPFVADADTATALLLQYEDEVHLIDAAQTSRIPEPSIDPFRRLFRVDWTPTAATRIADAATGKSLWNDTLDRGALFTAAQCLGLAQRAVHLAVEYAKGRSQFGKPIGSYQAVKHLLASVQVKIEFSRPVLHAAAAQFQHRDAHSRARIGHAKLVACEAADLAARTSIQVHGAMGYSWEVDVHFLLKRALAFTYAWGDPAFHRARIATRVFQYPLGPEHTFSRETTHV
jgi:alkylation response protein AidB-like acyl-CoA dehydrogenase